MDASVIIAAAGVMNVSVEVQRLQSEAAHHKRSAQFHRRELHRCMDELRRICEEHHIEFIAGGQKDHELTHPRIRTHSRDD